MNKNSSIMLICLLTSTVILACAPLSLLQPTEAMPTATQSLPGWHMLSGVGMEIWMPDSFEGGNLEEDLDWILENIRRLGPEYAQMADLMERNPSIFVIWAFDSEVGDSGFLTNVNVTTEKGPSSITLDTYLDIMEGKIPHDFQVKEREITTLNDMPAARLIVTFNISGVSGKELAYVVKDGTFFWVITCATGADEFAGRLPVFEQISATFRILR